MVVEITASHEARVGELLVRRALPRRGRRAIGAWCFTDHLGPTRVTPARGADVGPHPHMGLQTVTWLVEGEQLHRDSLGSEQLLRAGELNLMTAGWGVAHSEEAASRYAGALHGIQLWIAQPEHTRNGPAAFEHWIELPRFELTGGVATLLVGEHTGVVSPATVATPLIGMELQLTAGVHLPLSPSFEHGLVVLEGAVLVDGAVLTAGHLGYLPPGRDELTISVSTSTRMMLLGGEPLDEPVHMWWNFVGRNRTEFVEAYNSWTTDDGRFGTVQSPLARVLTTPPSSMAFRPFRN